MKRIVQFLLIISLMSCGNYSKTLVKKSEFVRVNESENVSVYRFEITNRQYNLFLNELKCTEQDKFFNFSPKSDGWTSKMGSIASIKTQEELYHSHDAFLDYPVTNITHEAATAYCVWLNSKLNKGNGNVVYRLPDFKEWLAVRAMITVDLSSDIAESRKEYNYNLKFVDNYVADGSLFAAYSNGKHDIMSNRKRNYRQSKNGIEHFIGNVSEMLQSYLYVGGSWDTLPSEVEQTEKLVGYDPRVGFRIVKVKL